MNTLQLLHRTRDASRILSAARGGDLDQSQLQELNQVLDALQFDRQAELNPSPEHWPMASQRRRQVERIALRSYMKTGSVPRELSGLMLAAQQTTSTTGGGYTIPQTVMAEIVLSIRQSGGMWQAARAVQTMRGSNFPWPYSIDTQKAYKINENADNETSAVAVAFGIVNLEKAAKYSSGLIRVPNELLEDSDLFVPALAEILRDRIFRGTNEDLTDGSGSGEANGILTAARYTFTAAAASITMADVSSLFFSVPAFSRNQPGACWMMHSTTLKHMMDQKDGTTPLFPTLWFDGSLLNRPVIENDDFPAFSDGGKVLAFGDFDRYVIRHTGINIKRLPEKHGDMDQTSFLATLRVDGDLVDPNAVAVMRVAAT